MISPKISNLSIVYILGQKIWGSSLHRGKFTSIPDRYLLDVRGAPASPLPSHIAWFLLEAEISPGWEPSTKPKELRIIVGVMAGPSTSYVSWTSENLVSPYVKCK